jgi:hypothetical protein
MKITGMLGTILPPLAASVLVTGATQAAPASRTVLAGSAPSWAKS